MDQAAHPGDDQQHDHAQWIHRHPKIHMQPADIQPCPGAMRRDEMPGRQFRRITPRQIAQRPDPQCDRAEKRRHNGRDGNRGAGARLFPPKKPGQNRRQQGQQ